MSYRFDQKIGKHVYVYEVESYWDKEKKQARQKRVYVGKRNLKTNQIIPAKKKDQLGLIKDFGDVYFVEQAIKMSGVLDAIEGAFSKDDAEIIKQLCIYKITESEPFYLYDSWIDGVQIEAAHKLSSQRISEFTSRLGSNDVGREEFFLLWSVMNTNVSSFFYDITSFSSYSKSIDLVEWGYNRDKEKLPQINFGVAMGLPSGLPIFYETYPGSIKDVSTIKNILKRIEAYGFTKIKFILDKGFFSGPNIESILEEKCDFVIPIPFTLNIAEELIVETLETLPSPSNLLYFKEGQALFCQKKKIVIKKHTVYAHIYLDEKRKAGEIENFAKAMNEVEFKFSKEKITTLKEAKIFSKEHCSGKKNIFNFSRKNNKITISRNNAESNKVIAKMGKIILITTGQDMSEDELMYLYRKKDDIEKCFDDLKNELEDNRLGASNNDSLRGRMFISFISLIVYTFITNKMKEQDLFKKFTIKKILSELRKIKHVEMINGKKIISEITKTQRDIFDAFKITIPW